MYLQHMLLKNKENYLEIYTFPSIMSIVFVSFKHPNMPISIKIPVTLRKLFIFV